MAAWRKGTLVECISDEHQRNVPIGTLGVVKKYSADGKLYTVRWFAYPREDDEDDGTGIIPDYFENELRKVKK